MKKRTEIYLLFLVLMGTLFGGCVATMVKQTTMRQTIEAPKAIEAKPLLLKKIVVILLRGEKTGSTQVGLMCIPGAPLSCRVGMVTPSGYECKQVFREYLEIANHPLIGNPDGLFEDPGEWNAEFLVPGLVKEMEANICYPKAGFKNYTPSKGEAFIKAKWQIAPPTRVTEVNRGEELYAIASPLDEKWRATTSKGIVCSHRREEGLADTLTNQIPRGVRSCNQNTISLPKEVVAQNQHRVDEADRLKFFLFLYCHTYESKDIDKFATLFAHDALENNKPFHELLPKYRRNMEMIESLDYRIDLVNYSLQASTGNIRLQGKFSIRYLLHGGTWKAKSGNISMELSKRGISYLVKRLNYSDEP